MRYKHLPDGIEPKKPTKLGCMPTGGSMQVSNQSPKSLICPPSYSQKSWFRARRLSQGKAWRDLQRALPSLILAPFDHPWLKSKVIFASTLNLCLCRRLGCSRASLPHRVPLELGLLAGGRDKACRSKMALARPRDMCCCICLFICVSYTFEKRNNYWSLLFSPTKMVGKVRKLRWQNLAINVHKSWKFN